MAYKVIGIANFGGVSTSIREYDNGFFVVEIDGQVKYSERTIDELKKKLDADGIVYKIT